MKRLSALFATIAALSLLFLSGCTNNPEKATQRDMLKHHLFFHSFHLVNGEDTHDYELIMNNDNTYSLYIEDHDNSTSDNVVMKTYTGNWSHVITYEYEWDKPISDAGVFSRKATVCLGIYLLEGYAWEKDGETVYNYFGYEKSTGTGRLFNTSETINEQFLESHRGIGGGFFTEDAKGHITLPGIYFKSEKAKVNDSTWI